MSDGTVTVLLVDDHAVVREGYRRLLERGGNIEVIGEADDADTAYAQFRALAPQVVVMDIALPGVSGVEAMRRMRAANPATRSARSSSGISSVMTTRVTGARTDRSTAPPPSCVPKLAATLPGL